MKWTGHSDYQAMKPYIDIAEKTKANAMKLFEQEMEKQFRLIKVTQNWQEKFVSCQKCITFVT
jgi:uncharacterized protein YueI